MDSVPVNLRRYVYCVGLSEGNSSDYEFLYQQYMTSENTADMVVILRALSCTRDKSSLTDYLTQSLRNDRIRVHDRTNAFTYALISNRENYDIILDFLFANFIEMIEAYGGESRFPAVLSNVGSYLTDFQDIQRFQTWLYANQVALGDAFNTGVSAVNSALSNLDWGSSVALELTTTLRSRNSAAAIATPLVLLLVALATHLLR